MTPAERKKAQSRTRNQKFYAAHREAMQARSRAYHDAHPGRLRAKRDPAKVSAYNRAYAAAHRAAKTARDAARWVTWKAALLELPVRFCRTCQTEKPSADFYPSYKTQCKACLKTKAAPTQAQKRVYVREWQAKNKERVQDWFSRNKERRARVWKAWFDSLPDDQKEALRERGRRLSSARAKAYPHLGRANNARRDAARLKATPAWANRAAVNAFYREAARLTRETGIAHEVDHIVPLRSRLVCGLHCEANLQILTSTANRQKGNRLPGHAATLR